MASIYEAAVMASILVGMVSIPAASQDLNVSKSFTGNISAVSSSEIPTSEVSRVTAGGFYRKVESAFQSFEASTSSDRTNLTLDSPGSELRIIQGSGRREFVLESPAGVLEIAVTPDTRTTTVTTPAGTLVTEESNGELTERFQGGNREAVEDTAADLRELLEQKRSVVEDKAENLKTRSLPSVSVTVKPDGDEYVQVQNLENTAIDLEGWTLKDEAGTEYEFGAVKLEAGDSLKVYTADGTDTGSELYWGTSSVWNDNGDAAYLYDDADNLVEKEAY